MQEFVQKVVERYIIFLFFDGLLFFSLVKQGEKSRKKVRAVLILTLFSAIIWVDYYFIYISRLPVVMAFVVPAILLLVGLIFRAAFFPYKRYCQNCGKKLSITEFLSCDENLCNSCYEEKHPESVKVPIEEKIRKENEEKKKGWAGWKPGREFVIAFAFDKEGNVLLIDNVGMQKVPGKFSGAIGRIKQNEDMSYTASRTLRKETGIECEAPEYMGRLNFDMPDMDIRFHVFVAREFSGELKEDAVKQPVWKPLKKLNYDLMSMDYPLWLPRMLRGQQLEYYAKCNAEGKIYEDILDLDAVI
ncbi:MAG: NUDIX domain-containing protein [Lachnospiraceae bacterium]|nr:NUDIX domain-containing protein [Lachnospiraceae bacterium]